ncbi:non-ribosomal peptide synthetase [Parasedimentitalea huanghaiensis]|uniref:AMP-binding protein n=1 Tax=Parasedimentitalea huanghaiensis TaxID=2682100 RepID=A0A6L6WLI5_9RHOB|nr:AMP-binding protein [Zongyanglinia huanghaiensis]MVO18534.1 AMP-binding protein [Zongyanglinia huanghaiensis]
MHETDDANGFLFALNQLDGSRVALRDGAEGVSVSFDQITAQIQETSAELATVVPPHSVLAYVADGAFASALMFLCLGGHAAVAPISARSTLAEVKALLQQLQPSVFVGSDTCAQFAGVAAELGIPVLFAEITERGRLRLRSGPAATVTPTQPRNLDEKGVVLTTSGTTGQPKMVALSTGRLIAGARAVASTIGLSAADTSVEIMPLHHIHGLVAGLLAPLLSGAEVVVQPNRDPFEFLQLAVRFGARWYTAVPTLHRAILYAAVEHPDLVSQCRFRVIRSSSSAMPFEIRQGVQDLFTCPVVEAYGMTEATHQISSQSPDSPCAHGTLGRPQPGTLKIQDAEGRRQPAGQVGEILLQSPTVITSYLANPAATRAAAVDGWMRTGDIGRINPDGTLSLVGREKEIIKRGGAQVAPPEIEDALLAQPGVIDAIAFGVPHPSLSQDVAAAVVLDHRASCDPRQLRNTLLDVLSAYKVPSKILQIQDIPKGPTGKPRRLDMHRLLAVELQGVFEAAQSPMEELLVALFGETLGRDHVSRQDDFFLSGGDSLSGSGLMAQLNQFFDIALSPELLFRFPTPLELASYLEALEGGRVQHRVTALAAAAQGNTGV